MSKPTFFNDDWLKNTRYSDWLVKVVENNRRARCKRCFKSFALSNIGEGALANHATSKIHTKKTEVVASFFKKSEKQQQCGEVEDVSNATAKVQAPLELVVSEPLKIQAEIRISLFYVMNGYSNNSIDSLFDLLSISFPDSKTAPRIKMKRTKLSYGIQHGLYPYFKSILEDNLKKADCYVISFDESLNEFTQNCQMDLLARFWCNDTNEVQVRYWDSKFIGHARRTDLLKNFNEGISSLDPTKLLQISMDGPNVNKKFYDMHNSQRIECGIHQLINIGTCSLHIVNGAFKSGEESTSWKIKKIFKRYVAAIA